MEESYHKKIYALVDCNSFFCSCEQLFRPDLIGKPVGVLSNNDGCFVSRTKELKALGIKMGEPYFKVKDICEKNNVAVFSSNFILYTNISDRIMHTLSQFTPELEVYSVDEAFLNLTGFNSHTLEDYARDIKATIEKHIGIPVSIGIGPTKTLAKVANHIAKKSSKAKGVVNLSDRKFQDIALSRTPISDVWGIGRAISTKLKAMNINTAKDFRDYKNDKLIQKMFTKVGLQRKQELDGKERFTLDLTPEKKKEIMVSRTFSQSVYDIESLRMSVASYATSATEKLRKQNSVCASIEVFTRTSPHKDTPQYYAHKEKKILSATSDTRRIIKYALDALDEIFKAGYEYKKSGVRITRISDKSQAQMSLFEKPDNQRDEKLMKVIDKINRKNGSGTIKFAVCGTNNSSWKMNRNFKSPNYVGSFYELPKVK